MKKTIATATALAVLGTGVFAQDLPREVRARQGAMQILAINLGILGGMAKGEMEYSADAATAAADSIAAISMVNLAPLFPAGTSEMDIDGTRAKAEIWDNLADVASSWQSLQDAVPALQTAAAEGQAAIGPALGQVGKACQACHDDYQAPRN